MYFDVVKLHPVVQHVMKFPLNIAYPIVDYFVGLIICGSIQKRCQPLISVYNFFKLANHEINLLYSSHNIMFIMTKIGTVILCHKPTCIKNLIHLLFHELLPIHVHVLIHYYFCALLSRLMVTF